MLMPLRLSGKKLTSPVQKTGNPRPLPPSTHHLLAHSAERLHLNDCFGLSKFSEEALDATPKDLRKVCKILARNTVLMDNVHDVHKFLFTRSDPLVRTHRRMLTCSVCDGKGNTKRSCPTVGNSYDDLFKLLLSERIGGRLDGPRLVFLQRPQYSRVFQVQPCVIRHTSGANTSMRHTS